MMQISLQEWEKYKLGNVIEIYFEIMDNTWSLEIIKPKNMCPLTSRIVLLDQLYTSVLL